MHELGIARNIVLIVEEAAHGRRVLRVTLEIGEHAGVTRDAIAFCFDAVTRGTVLEGAALEIRAIKARACCKNCGGTFTAASMFTPCACGSRQLEWLQGGELTIKSIELAEAA
jgi:hydrogenase nickel incorporation protein HypA/HybF